jgi:UDP-perosamine 4-acetyltransferase
MAKDIIIIGAGGFAVELYHFMKQCIFDSADWNISGFSAIGKNVLSEYNLSHLYLGDYDKTELPKSAELTIGVGAVHVREKIFDEFRAKGYKFANIIHPQNMANLEALNKSEGNIFMYGSGGMFLSIGNGNLLNGNSGLSHEVKIGDFNILSQSVMLGRAKVGSFNSFGFNSVVMPDAKIGNNNKISAGSYVYKGCRDNCIMHGNPAEKIGVVE